MDFISIPNTVMGELIFYNGNSYSENTLYFQKSTAIQDSDPEEVTIFLESWWKANCQPLVASGVSLNKIKATDLSVEDGFFAEFAVANGAGAVGSGILPMNVTGAVKFNTGRSGRSYRGRNYWVGLSEGQVVGDVIDAAVRVSIMAAYMQLKDDAGTAGFTWVVASRFMNNQPRTVGIATQIISVTMNSEVDSQRRRLFGRGS